MWANHETLLLFVDDLPPLMNASSIADFRDSFNECRSAPYLCPSGEFWLDNYHEFWLEQVKHNQTMEDGDYFSSIIDYMELNPHIQEFVHMQSNK